MVTVGEEPTTDAGAEHRLALTAGAGAQHLGVELLLVHERRELRQGATVVIVMGDQQRSLGPVADRLIAGCGQLLGEPGPCLGAGDRQSQQLLLAVGGLCDRRKHPGRDR